MKLERLCPAFTSVSCARSSAASWLPVSERAKARRNGTRPSNSVLKSSLLLSMGLDACGAGVEVCITTPSFHHWLHRSDAKGPESHPVRAPAPHRHTYGATHGQWRAGGRGLHGLFRSVSLQTRWCPIAVS